MFAQDDRVFTAYENAIAFPMFAVFYVLYVKIRKNIFIIICHPFKVLLCKQYFQLCTKV